MKTGAARRFYEDLEPQAGEHLADAECEVAGAGEGFAVQLGLFSLTLFPGVEIRVEIENDEIRVIQDRLLEIVLRSGKLPALAASIWGRIHAGKPGMQLQAPHLRQE